MAEEGLKQERLLLVHLRSIVKFYCSLSLSLSCSYLVRGRSLSFTESFNVDGFFYFRSFSTLTVSPMLLPYTSNYEYKIIMQMEGVIK